MKYRINVGDVKLLKKRVYEFNAATLKDETSVYVGLLLLYLNVVPQELKTKVGRLK